MNDIAIDVKDVTIRFNLASEKIDNLKEYFVKLIKHEFSFKSFLLSGMLLLQSVKERRGLLWEAMVPASRHF